MWIDKQKFHELISDYQFLNDDIDPSWLNSKLIRPKGMSDDVFETYKENRRKFVEFKKGWYQGKKERLEKETPQDTKERHLKMEQVADELFKIFYELIDSVLAGFGFQQMNADESKMDLKQDVMTRLLVVVNRFDSRKENPLAYFIQVIKNLAYNLRADEFSHRYKFLTNSFLETHELKEDKNSVQQKQRKQKEKKEKPNPFNTFID